MKENILCSEWKNATILKGEPLMVSSTASGYKTYNICTKEIKDSTDGEIDEFKTLTTYDKNSLSENNIKQFSDYAERRRYNLNLEALRKTPIISGKYCGWWCPIIKNRECPCFPENGYCEAKIFIKK